MDQFTNTVQYSTIPKRHPSDLWDIVQEVEYTVIYHWCQHHPPHILSVIWCEGVEVVPGVANRCERENLYRPVRVHEGSVVSPLWGNKRDLLNVVGRIITRVNLHDVGANYSSVLYLEGQRFTHLVFNVHVIPVQFKPLSVRNGGELNDKAYCWGIQRCGD